MGHACVTLFRIDIRARQSLRTYRITSFVVGRDDKAFHAIYELHEYGAYRGAFIHGLRHPLLVKALDL